MGLLGVAFQFVQDKFGLFPRTLAAIGDDLFKQGAGFGFVCREVASGFTIYVVGSKRGLCLGMPLCGSLFAQGNGAAWVLRVVVVYQVAYGVFQGEGVLRIGVAQGRGFFPPFARFDRVAEAAVETVVKPAELVLGGGMILRGSFF